MLANRQTMLEVHFVASALRCAAGPDWMASVGGWLLGKGLRIKFISVCLFVDLWKAADWQADRSIKACRPT